jgi:hypothetical protein
VNSSVAELMKWLDECKAECVASSMKLIREDAPKNKFSIISGKMSMIDEVQTKIEQIEKALQ